MLYLSGTQGLMSNWTHNMKEIHRGASNLGVKEPRHGCHWGRPRGSPGPTKPYADLPPDVPCTWTNERHNVIQSHKSTHTSTYEIENHPLCPCEQCNCWSFTIW